MTRSVHGWTITTLYFAAFSCPPFISTLRIHSEKETDFGARLPLNECTTHIMCLCVRLSGSGNCLRLLIQRHAQNKIFGSLGTIDWVTRSFTERASYPKRIGWETVCVCFFELQLKRSKVRRLSLWFESGGSGCTKHSGRRRLHFALLGA